MRILVTGSAGHIGRSLAAALRDAGHEIRTFDRQARNKQDDWEHLPGDLRDIDTVRQAVQGMDAVAHLGAIASDRRGSGEDVLTVNVQGTWNILIASVEAGVERVVSYSSINALGCVGGHRPVDYLPVDDAYPPHPMSPYQLSKHLGEEACRSYTEKHGLITLCLRPGFVATPEHYHWFRDRDRSQESRAIYAKDELWAYVDRRDVIDATLRSLTVQNVTHDAFLLLAADTTLTIPTAELVDKYYPDTPWKQERATFLADDPFHTLLDCSHARDVLGWEPKHSWRDTE